MHEILWKHGAVDALLGFLKSDHWRLQRVAVGALFGLLDYGNSYFVYLFDPKKILIQVPTLLLTMTKRLSRGLLIFTMITRAGVLR